MFDIGQEVTVITDKGIAYDGVVLARANSDQGQGAYKISVSGAGLEQMSQWHKSSDVFLREKSDADEDLAWETLIDKIPANDPAQE